MWFDPDVNRLNYDEHGRLLGEFYDDDQILVVLKNGDFYLTNFDVNNHYEENILLIEKYQADKVWTAVLFDADNQGYPYMKRFLMEALKRKQNFMGDNPTSKLVLLSDQVYPLIKVVYGGQDEYRGSEEIDAEQFIAVKGFRAKGKRISTWQIESIEELEPQRFPTEEPAEPEEEAEPTDRSDDQEPEEPLQTDGSDDDISNRQIIDEKTGQLSFDF